MIARRVFPPLVARRGVRFMVHYAKYIADGLILA